MPSAFILINSEMGKERDILYKLRDLPFIFEAWIVYGVYDLIACIEGEDLDFLKNVITKHIRTIEFINKTFTMIIEDG